jgi:hypothetical protein
LSLLSLFSPPLCLALFVSSPLIFLPMPLLLSFFFPHSAPSFFLSFCSYFNSSTLALRLLFLLLILPFSANDTLSWQKWNKYRLCGQSFRLQIQRSRVRFPALPHFLRRGGFWNGVHSASWGQLRSYLNEKIASPF